MERTAWSEVWQRDKIFAAPIARGHDILMNDRMSATRLGGKPIKKFFQPLTEKLKPMKKHEEFQECAEHLKAVADPDRLRIVMLLLDGELSVGDIASKLKEEIVKVSHHLGILRRAKIVQASKQGRYMIYSLHPKVFIAPTGPNDEPQLEFGCCHLNLNS